MRNILKKYAQLLVNYCVEIKEGDHLFLNSTTLAEPLIREVYREAVRIGANVEVELDFREKGRIFLEEANEAQLNYIPKLYNTAMREFDAYIYIRAPFNLREGQSSDPEKVKIRKAAMQPVSKVYFERTATRDLKRNLCQYPTQASAQEAGMSLEEYREFVFKACNGPRKI